MISIAIIDDEENARFILKAEIKKYYSKSIKHLYEASSVADGLDLLNTHKIDLLFLDIELGDGNAFNILTTLDKIDFKVVFVTAYHNFALKAFEFFALGYLIKPFKTIDLKTVINKYLEDKRPTNKSSIKILSESIIDKKIKKIVLPDIEGFQIIYLSDILYLQSDNNYTEFHLKNKNKYLSSRTLKDYERLLEDQGFFRCHRKYLINLDHVLSYSKQDGGYITLITKDLLPIGRRKVAEFRKLFM